MQIRCLVFENNINQASCHKKEILKHHKQCDLVRSMVFVNNNTSLTHLAIYSLRGMAVCQITSAPKRLNMLFLIRQTHLLLYHNKFHFNGFIQKRKVNNQIYAPMTSSEWIDLVSSLAVLLAPIATFSCSLL